MVNQTKAEKAAIILANEKIDTANAYYNWHKDVIDEYHKLQEEASTAIHRVSLIKINRINRGDFDKISKPPKSG